VVPLAKRTATLRGPAAAAVTVHSTYAPATLSPLTNPVPV
jgi:hypothetical protein